MDDAPANVFPPNPFKMESKQSFLGINGLSGSSSPLFTPSYPVLLFWACGVKAAIHIRENGAGKVLERKGDAEPRQKGALIILRKTRGPATGKGVSAKLLLAYNFLLKVIIRSWRWVSHDVLFPANDIQTNIRANAIFV